MVVKLESNFWHMQVTQVQNERVCSSLTPISPFWTAFSPMPCFWVQLQSCHSIYMVLHNPTNNYFCYQSLSICRSPPPPHLPTSAFRLFPPIPPAYNQGGFLKTKFLSFTPSAQTLLVLPIAQRIKYKFSSWMSTVWPKTSKSSKYCKHVRLRTRHCTHVRTSEHDLSPLSL